MAKTMKQTTQAKKIIKKPTKNKSLAKGLDAIFGDDLKSVLKEIEVVGKPKIMTKSMASKPIAKVAKQLLNEVKQISLSKIIPSPYQPRRVFDQEKLMELANSIKQNGLLTPIVVRETKAGTYYIIAGERRYRASKLNKLTKIKAIIINVTDKKMQELALIENIQREDLNPIEEAVAVKQLINDYRMTHEAASKILGKSRTYITNTLRLLKLDGSIVEAVLKGKLTFGHAKPLISLDIDTSKLVCKKILDEKLTVREVENIVRGYKLRNARANASKKPAPKKSAEIEYVEELVRNKLKAKVNVLNNKIVIKYRGVDQLNRILARMDVLEK